MERQQTAKLTETNAASRNNLQAKAAPQKSTPSHPILQLQRKIGNQAVQRLLSSSDIRAKLKISQPGDEHEQEADRVADQVMRPPETESPGRMGISAPIHVRHVQRMCAECEEEVQRQEEEEELEETPIQTKQHSYEIAPIVERQVVRKKEQAIEATGGGLATAQRQEAVEGEGEPISKFPHQRQQEIDEETVAREEEPDEEIARQPAEIEEEISPLLLQRQAETLEKKLEEGIAVQRPEAPEEDTAVTEPLRRQEEPEEESAAADLVARQEDEHGEKAILAKRSPHRAALIPRDFESQLQRSRGEGRSLPTETREFFEPRIGADFSSVRVHTGLKAGKLNRSIHARAFTRGSDIYFSEGAYDPGSSSGKRLLAHELTHVVQQGNAPAVHRFGMDVGGINQVGVSSFAQRQEATAEPGSEVEPAPSEQQKAAALAAAAQAEKIASQAAAFGRQEITKSKQAEQKETVEKEAQDTAKKGAQNAVKAAGKKQAAKKAKPEAAKLEEVGAEEAEAEAAPGPAVTEKAPASPEEDPAFQSVVEKIGTVAKKERKHAPAKAKANEAQNAAKSPAEEIAGKAQNKQVGEMEQAETPAFDAKAFRAQLMKRIEELAPKSLKEADDFKQNNKLGDVKAEMQGQVAGEKAASEKPLAEKTAADPDTASVEPKPFTPIPEAAPGGAPPDVGAQGAAPKTKGESELEKPMQENTERIGAELEKENITEEQLANSGETSFQAALETKKQAEAHTAESTQSYRQFEGDQLSKAETDAAATADKRTQGMHGSRAQLLQQVHGTQEQSTTKDEQARAKVGQDIHKIYESTKTRVNQILEALDGKVEKAFDEGAAAAKQIFEDYVDARMEAYKERRYGGWLGWARWGKDKLLGMPDAVNVFYKEGRDHYLRKMNAVIDNVVAIIGAELTAAKAEIAKGKKEIQNYVEQLPENLKAVGAEAAENIQSQFDELEASVDNKQNELIDSLARKYQENLQAIDARIEEMKAANQGLVDKAINAVVGVIKTIIEIKNLLLTVLAKIASVVTKIIKDPIGFLGNLIAGLKQGFENFVGNIVKHLQTGLIGWLTGALGPMGIRMPEDIFSLKGIFSLVMQVLGLGWDLIRGKAVKLLGERVVSFLETAFEPFKILITEGVGGLWNYVKERFADLKEMVIEQIKDMVITQVITAGIKWLIGLLNPAAAFIKAATTIYEIVKFFWERAKQIGEFISSIVDAVAAIAKGAISGAASLVENALAKALPLVIGFLANLLGIGDLANKVTDFIKRLRSRIEKTIDTLLLKAKKLVGKLFKKAKREPKKNGKPGEQENAADVALVGERPSVEVPFVLAKAPHVLSIAPRAGGVVVLMSSDKKLPLHAQFKAAHIAINQFKHYMSTVTDPGVLKDYNDNILPKIEGLQVPQADAFAAIYNELFPKPTARGPSAPQITEQEAKAKVKGLVTKAESLLSELKAWGAATGISDLTEDVVNATLRTKGDAAWRASFTSTRDAIIETVSRFSYKGKPVKFTGSAFTGWKGPHKGQIHFDAADFDVDMYVVHPDEFRAVKNKGGRVIAGKIFPSVFTPELLMLQREVAGALKARFPTVKRIGESTIVLRETEA